MFRFLVGSIISGHENCASMPSSCARASKKSCRLNLGNFSDPNDRLAWGPVVEWNMRSVGYRWLDLPANAKKVPIGTRVRGARQEFTERGLGRRVDHSEKQPSWRGWQHTFRDQLAMLRSPIRLAMRKSRSVLRAMTILVILIILSIVALSPAV